MSNRAFFRDRFLLTLLRIESLHSLAPSLSITADCFVMLRDSGSNNNTLRKGRQQKKKRGPAGVTSAGPTP